jgi:hypothetical protein
MLEESSESKKIALFIPKDATCITSPNTSNSYMNKVSVRLWERFGGVEGEGDVDRQTG